MDKNSLNQTATETIRYEKADGSEAAPAVTATINYSRTAEVNLATGEVTYGAWKADGSDTFAAVTSPTVTDFTPDQKEVPAVQDDSAVDVNLVVYYYPTTVTVDPKDPKTPTDTVDPKNPASPKYPAGVDKNSLNQTATETIRYEKADGSEAAPAVTATINYSRTAEVNLATGEVTYGAWKTDGSDTFAAVTSPTVTDFTPDQAIVPAVQDDSAVDVNLVVYYYPTTVTVDPKDPKTPTDTVDPKNPASPKYPAGVDKNSLNQTATETIRYEKADGSEAAPAVTATINYSRTATINLATGAVTYGAWKADGSDTFKPVTSPTVPNYTPDQAEVLAVQDDSAVDVNLVVYYYSTTVTVDPKNPKTPTDTVDPKNPASPKYPDGVDKASLNKDGIQIIHYVDQDGHQVAPDSRQTIHFVRTATVDYSTAKPTVTYGAWTPADGDGSFASVTSPTVSGMTPDRAQVATMTDEGPFPISLVVTYYPTVQTIDITHTKTPGSPLNPNNPDGPRYPDGLTADDLQTTATRTVHFVDGSGRTVAPDVVESIHYVRTAKVDFSNPDAPLVTYSAWVADGDNVFAAVNVPTVDGLTPDRLLVPALTFTGAAGNMTVTVVYHTTPRTLPQTGGDGGSATTTPRGGAYTPTRGGGSAKSATPTAHTLPQTGARTLPQTGGSATPTAKAKRTLPQTGDDHESTAAFMGLTVLGMLLGLVGYKKRRDDED